MESNVQISEVYFCGVCRMCHPIENVASIFGAKKGTVPDYICSSCARFPVPHDWESPNRSTNATFRGLGNVNGFNFGESSSFSGTPKAVSTVGGTSEGHSEGSKRKFGEAFPIRKPDAGQPMKSSHVAF